MDEESLRPSLALRRLVNGYQVSQAIHVAATLGIADLLGAGPHRSDDLAASTGTHPPSLYRLLRALASVGVFREEDDHRFALTELGMSLCADAPEPVDGWAAYIGQPYHWAAWGDLLHSVRSGENAFRHIHGMDSWAYRAQHPELSAAFDYAMATNSRRILGPVLDAYDFGRFSRVVDVGGGNGALLAAILARHPAARGVLFDQPHVVSGAGPLLASAGVVDRCEVIAGSFFETVPAGGDAYVLKAILHDWEDAECIRILRTCRQAMADGTALLVVEQELCSPNEGPDAKFSDLNMLVGPGGRERTTQEYARLFQAAGFRFIRFVPSTIGYGVFEGSAA